MNLPLQVRLETEVNEAVIREEKPDVLFVAAGSELAVELQQNGNTGTMLEMTVVLAVEAPHFHRVAMLECMKALEGVHTGMNVREIRDSTVYAESRDGETAVFPENLIVLACGMRQNKALEACRTLVPRYIPIGNCYVPQRLATLCARQLTWLLIWIPARGERDSVGRHWISSADACYR